MFRWREEDVDGGGVGEGSVGGGGRRREVLRNGVDEERGVALGARERAED